MMILARPQDHPSSRRMLVVFGVGLIGSALVEALYRHGPWRTQRHHLSWTDPARYGAEIASAEATLADAQATRLHVVWCAGRAGFGATEIEADLSTFRTALAMAERLATARPEREIAFHLISSAGGLFEGQRHVDQDSVPAPRRPYAELKLRQEEMLAAASERLVKRVYRLTSVYGHPDGPRRRGLITTLLVNGLRQRVSSIVGRATTLRDFTWAGDVGGFIARELLSAEMPRTPATYTLAAGLPTSILEVSHVVEGVLRRPLYVSYSFAPTNAEDITFSPKLRPPGWVVSDLKTNVKNMYYEALKKGFGD